jgi:hypothetical protein
MVDPIGNIQPPDVLIVIHHVLFTLLQYTYVPTGLNPQ